MSTESEGARSDADAMSSAEYRVCLARMEMTQGAAGKLLGVDARTSRKWANGEREVPPTAARLLRYLIAAGVTPEEFAAALARFKP